MEIKKSPKADLQNKRGLMLEIGLAVSLLLVIACFAYTPKEYRIDEVELDVAIVEAEQIEITHTPEEEPPIPQKVQMNVITDILTVVDNTEKVEVDFDFADFDENVEIVQQVAVQEEEIVEDEIFIQVEQMPSFQGGDLATFRNWVQSQIRYPALAAENNIMGKVIVQFLVDKEGRLTDIQVLQSPDRSLSDEAVRVLKLSPRWEPGRQRNQPARVRHTLPVVFQLKN